MKNYNVIIHKEGKFFVVKNIDLWIVSQWKSIEESLKNIKEATQLYLEDEKQEENLSKETFISV